MLLEYAAEATTVDISGGDGNQYEEGSLAAASKITLSQHCMVTVQHNLLLFKFAPFSINLLTCASHTHTTVGGGTLPTGWARVHSVP